MTKVDWICFWAIIAFAAWVIYRNSRKTPTERFFFGLAEDISKAELEALL
jgi:hypothetical protein